jgi:hypothetical protein
MLGQQIKTNIKTITIENRTILVKYLRSNSNIKINKENAGQGYRI